MRIVRVRLQDFRNIAFADVDVDAPRVFVHGRNGQGKSNLLEALGLPTAFRSFRTRNDRAMARREGEGGFAAVFDLLAGDGRRVVLEMRFGRGGKAVLVDGTRCSRLAEFIGRFPVVALSSADINLVRGSPGVRRRSVDILLAATDPDYFELLQRYHRGVAGRNRLLKRGASDAELTAFEREIAPPAAELVRQRADGVADLARMLDGQYRAIAGGDDAPGLAYRTDAPEAGPEAVLRALAGGRQRDRALGITRHGPHRDDYLLTLGGRGAQEFGSDGQQRSLCLAWRLAQAELMRKRLGCRPVYLVDDVLGELDAGRSEGFWRAHGHDSQVIASGTRRPADGDGWRFLVADAGRFSEA